PDEIKVSVYIRQCSSLLDIEERVLLSELNKIRLAKARSKEKKDAQAQQNQAPVAMDIPPGGEEWYPAEMLAAMGAEVPSPAPVQVESAELRLEKELVRILLNYGRELVHWEGDGDVPVAPYLLASLDDIEIVDNTCKLIVEEFAKQAESFQVPEAKVFFSHENADVSTLAVDSVVNKYELSPSWNDDKRKIFVPEELDQLKTLVVQVIYRIKKNKIEVQMQSIRDELKQTTDDADLQILLAKYQKLKEGEQMLGSLLGNIVVK